ncbi:MAG: Spy/CpxP family protein refolding chaperone [Deltaproteobacteria bacterium]|nr:Spy/CpxP family protein refolding chaperone [Deltaproteobacteria bacterium]
MKKLTMTLVAVFAVTTLAAYAYAFGPGWGRGHGGGQCYSGGYYGGDITAVPGINLTAEQTAKINALRDANLRDIKPLQDKLFSKRGDLRLLWLQTNPDQNKILATQKEVRALRDQMQDKMISNRLEVLKILTPEQQEKLKSYGPGRGFGPGMRGGAGMHGGGPGTGMMRGNW